MTLSGDAYRSVSSGTPTNRGMSPTAGSSTSGDEKRRAHGQPKDDPGRASSRQRTGMEHSRDMAADSTADTRQASIEYHRVDMLDRPVLNDIVKINKAGFAWSTAVDAKEDLDQPCKSSRNAIVLRRVIFRGRLMPPGEVDPIIIAGVERVNLDIHFCMMNHRTTDPWLCIPALHMTCKRDRVHKLIITNFQVGRGLHGTTSSLMTRGLPRTLIPTSTRPLEPKSSAWVYQKMSRDL